MSTSTQDIGIPLEWIDFDETPILFANHFLVQHQLEEFVVSLGQVVGPPPVGPPPVGPSAVGPSPVDGRPPGGGPGGSPGGASAVAG
jgi:hypothetical protein